MIKKKYKLRKDLSKPSPKKIDKEVYRIEALIDIEETGVKKGQLGGYVESEDNLSHEGSCWIFDEDCIVLEYARIYGNSKILGRVVIEDNCSISGNTVVEGIKDNIGLNIQGNVNISGQTRIVRSSGYIRGETNIRGLVCIEVGFGLDIENSQIHCDKDLTKNSSFNIGNICGSRIQICSSKLIGEVSVYDNSRIEESIINGLVIIRENTEILDCIVKGNDISIKYGTNLNKAIVKSNKDYVLLDMWWREGKLERDLLTWTRSNNLIYNPTELFNGPLELFIEKFKEGSTDRTELEKIKNYIEQIK